MFNVMINLIEVLAQRVFSSQSLGVNSRHCRMEQDNANERLEQRLRHRKSTTCRCTSTTSSGKSNENSAMLNNRHHFK
jgi:hypothetical protein